MRLRQIALVTQDLSPVVEDLKQILGIRVCFIDPGVDVFGLENAVIPFAGNFLEVLAPIQENTAGGRYLDRRGGDGGYMIMLQCPDALAERTRITGLGIRSVYNIDGEAYTATHFHPKDVGTLLLSVDSVEAGADYLDPSCSWTPAGPKWNGVEDQDSHIEMVGIEIQTPDPADLAQLWAKIINLPAEEKTGNEWHIDLSSGVIRFVPETDGRGVGVGGIDIKIADKDRVLETARQRGCETTDSMVVICGTRFNIA